MNRKKLNRPLVVTTVLLLVAVVLLVVGGCVGVHHCMQHNADTQRQLRSKKALQDLSLMTIQLVEAQLRVRALTRSLDGGEHSLPEDVVTAINNEIKTSEALLKEAEQKHEDALQILVEDDFPNAYVIGLSCHASKAALKSYRAELSQLLKSLEMFEERRR